MWFRCLSAVAVAALTGIVALGDIATEPDAAAEARVGAAMAEISEPSRPRK